MIAKLSVSFLEVKEKDFIKQKRKQKQYPQIMKHFQTLCKYIYEMLNSTSSFPTTRADISLL